MPVRHARLVIPKLPGWRPYFESRLHYNPTCVLNPLTVSEVHLRDMSEITLSISWGFALIQFFRNTVRLKHWFRSLCGRGSVPACIDQHGCQPGKCDSWAHVRSYSLIPSDLESTRCQCFGPSASHLLCTRSAHPPLFAARFALHGRYGSRHCLVLALARVYVPRLCTQVSRIVIQLLHLTVSGC